MHSPAHWLLVSLLAELSTPYQRENFQSLFAARLADESKARIATDGNRRQP
jgi:hypothetical protein